MPDLIEWDSFYLIVGTAGAALIGLQFIFMTLLASGPDRPSPDASQAFGTPTIVHFCTVLLVSALVRAPWKTAKPITMLIGLLGLAGVAYIIVVSGRMRAQHAYSAGWEDWLGFAVVPGVGYGILAFSAGAALSDLRDALFGIAAAVLLLLFVGIRNSWDTVTYHVLVKHEENANRSRPRASKRDE